MSSNTPQLRFAEFSGEWQETPIKVIGEVIGGGTPSTAITEYWNGDINWYTPSEIGKTRFINKSERRISNTGLKNSSAKLLPIGTILLTSRATIGEMSILKEIGCTNQGFQSIVLNNSNDRDFIYYSLSRIKNELIKKSSGSTFLEISANKIREIEFFAPKSAEQQKIGSFLSAVDSKIEGLEQELGLLKRYKQGIMQRLFNQTLRFKDNHGNPFPAWKEIRLGKAFKLQGGFAFKSEEFTDLGIPIIRISNIPIIGDNIDLSDCIYYEEIPNELNFIVNNGDLMIAMSGATTGKTAIYRYPNKAYLNQRVGLFKLVDNNNHYPFIYHLVKSTSFMTQLKSTLVAGAQPNISSKDIESFIVNLPKKDEQKKIADFLSDLDAKIEATQKQLDSAREWKKGLLQKMFV